MDGSGRTQLVRLRNARFVVNGGSPDEQQNLVRLLGHMACRAFEGTLIVAKRTDGRWLIVGRDEESCAAVLACLKRAGVAADVLWNPD